MVGVLRVSCRPGGAGFVVELGLEGAGARRAAEAGVGFGLSAQDREDVRWYLEDFLQYPVAPAPQVAGRVQARLAELGADLFRQVFEANRDAIRLWDAVRDRCLATRVEVDAGTEGGSGVPWELLRDPATDGVLALRAGAFVRTHPETAVPVQRAGAAGRAAGAAGDLPAGRAGGCAVPVGGQPPGTAEPGSAGGVPAGCAAPADVRGAGPGAGGGEAAGEPYQVVHFDGHGTWLDEETAAGGGAGRGVQPGGVLAGVAAAAGVARVPGVRGPGYRREGSSWWTARRWARLLAGAGVPVLVLNACRSAHADLAAEPDTVTGEGDAHGRVRAYGSLAQEVMDAGVAGVVAMRYNVYVVTAASSSATCTRACWPGSRWAGRWPRRGGSWPPTRSGRSAASRCRCRTGWSRWSTRPPRWPCCRPKAR